jgi:recombination protein RecA
MAISPEKQAEGRIKSVDNAITQIHRQFGKGSIMRLGAHERQNIPVISTGVLGIDLALGVGGLPRGRVTEIYGPESSGKTTLALHVIAEAQRMGGNAAFVDAEHALDTAYAEKLGVDVDNLLVSQPDFGEQALEICEILMRSGGLDVIVVDSVAALVPKAEIDGSVGDMHVGLQARLMSQAMRKFTSVLQRTNTVLIFINQIRMKIGVMFGCFHYDARVMLADGTSEKIGKIVNQKVPLEVMSYNVTTGEFEPRRIVNWFNNGPAELFLQFTVDANSGNGHHAFGCTPNHLLLSEYGYRPAGELKVGDRLMTMVEYYLSPIQEQVVLGSILGDGSLRQISDYNTALRIGHGQAQDAYCLWKQSLFEGLIGSETTNMRGGHSFDTIPMYELTKLRVENYDEKGKNPSQTLIDRLTPLAVAVWYMDDGTFDSERQNRCSISCPGFPLEKQQALVRWFHERGIMATLTARGSINFGVQETPKFHAMIARYIHPSMEYKLLPTLRGQFVQVEATAQRTLKAVPMPILDIHEKPETRGMNRFDLEIDDNHCYVVDGVVVHNSPETTTGGNALKFYSSIRLDIRRLAQIKDGQEVIGNRTKIKVVKNKVAPPFKEIEFDIIYGEGISRSGDLLDLAVEKNIIDKSGAWYAYQDERIGQGRENSKNFLKEHPEMLLEIDQKVRQSYALPTGAAASSVEYVPEDEYPEDLDNTAD